MQGCSKISHLGNVHLLDILSREDLSSSEVLDKVITQASFPAVFLQSTFPIDSEIGEHDTIWSCVTLRVMRIWYISCQIV